MRVSLLYCVGWCWISMHGSDNLQSAEHGLQPSQGNDITCVYHATRSDSKLHHLSRPPRPPSLLPPLRYFSPARLHRSAGAGGTSRDCRAEEIRNGQEGYRSPDPSSEKNVTLWQHRYAEERSVSDAARSGRRCTTDDAYQDITQYSHHVRLISIPTCSIVSMPSLTTTFSAAWHLQKYMLIGDTYHLSHRSVRALFSLWSAGCSSSCLMK